jgi:hypothetical protein
VPVFIREIRRLFTATEVRDYLDRLEHTKYLAPHDEDLEKSSGAQELLRFSRVRELLEG